MQKSVSKDHKNIRELIRQKNDIVDIAERCGYPLTKKGQSWRHGSKGSLSVSPEKQLWYDFENHQGGDVIDFVRLRDPECAGSFEKAVSKLLPEEEREKYAPQISAYMRDEKREQDDVSKWNSVLLARSDMEICRNALGYLHDERKISDEQIKEKKIGIILADKATDDADANKKIQPRIVIPLWDENGKVVKYHISRAFRPGDEPRYKKPFNDQNNVFLRSCPAGLETLSKGNNSVWFVEGIFDYLDLDGKGYSVLASTGGGMSDEMISYAWQFERVILAFDNDEAGQKYTKDAARNLFNRGINFDVIQLPEGVKDVAEFYERGGDFQELENNKLNKLEYLMTLFSPDKSQSKKQEKEQKAEIKKIMTDARKSGASEADITEFANGLINAGFDKNYIEALLKKAMEGESESEIAAKIRESHELIFHEKTGFYEYAPKKGIWQPTTTNTVAKYVHAYLGKIATSKRVSGVVKNIQYGVNDDENFLINRLNRLPLFVFKNGTFRYSMNGRYEFGEHAPENFASIRLGYDYDKNAECERWLQFIQEVTNNDSERAAVLQEFAGYVFYTDCRLGKILIPIGEGKNGKNVFAEVLRHVFGVENCTSISADKFGENFQMITLKDSLLNLSTETSKALNKSRDNLFKIATGDPMTDSYKGKDNITFSSRAKLIVCMNNYPEINDNTYALERRLLFVDFPITFKKNPKGENEKLVDVNLLDKLKTELPGIFNWCVEGFQRLIRNGSFTENADTLRNIRALKAMNNELYDFVDECIEQFFGHKVERAKIYDLYSSWCERNHIAPKSSQKFHAEFRRILKLKVVFGESQAHNGNRYYAFVSWLENVQTQS